MNYKDIGIRASKELKKVMPKDVSQGDFLKSIGICENSMYQWAKGRCLPTAPALVKLCNCGCDIKYILTGER